MKSKHYLLLGPHTMRNSSRGGWENYQEGADSQTMATQSAIPRNAVKATNLDPRKTNPNKC